MKNGTLFFFGLFGALALSWAVLVFGSSNQLGNVKTHFDTLDNLTYPQPMPGIMAQGKDVYRSLGCASCHTQQVRRPNYGNDKARGFGEHQSVARDYMLQTLPQLGASRRGPDLANFGLRATAAGLDRTTLLVRLYTGQGSMPAYPFLFEQRPVIGTPLSTALPVATAPGMQVIATSKANALADYLLGLKQEYVFPEATPVETTEEAGK